MADKKVDISINDLLKKSIDAIAKSDSAPIIFTPDKNIPVRKGKKRMPKVDPNINNKFRIKRIGYDVIAKITTDRDDLYRATVVSIADGISPFAVDESFPISKRELELCGRKILDI
jgi:hypothetical protein